LARAGGLEQARSVPTFAVTRSHGWYEAACPELGVTITARRLEDIEATARRAALRALGSGASVNIVMAKRPAGVLTWLAGLLGRDDREGHS
jgi:hypothetical protein